MKDSLRIVISPVMSFSNRLQAELAMENMVRDIARQKDRIYDLEFSSFIVEFGIEKMELVGKSLASLMMLERTTSEQLSKRTMTPKYPMPRNPKVTAGRRK